MVVGIFIGVAALAVVADFWHNASENAREKKEQAVRDEGIQRASRALDVSMERLGIQPKPVRVKVVDFPSKCLRVTSAEDEGFFCFIGQFF